MIRDSRSSASAWSPCCVSFRPTETIRAFEYEGGDPGIVRLDPEWHQAAWTFVKMGFHHILDGADHLLFLFCLVIPFRRFRGLIPVVTAFTVAHSITLIASAYDMAPGAPWFPPLIETLIAASIVYMALENIVVANPRRRWMITFCFGLVHGFGFSFALRQTLQFAGKHMLTSLLSFNIGVELGQIFILALMVPALAILFRYAAAERIGTIILSAFAAHSAWHWMDERYEQLSKFPFEVAGDRCRIYRGDSTLGDGWGRAGRRGLADWCAAAGTAAPPGNVPLVC